MIRPVCPVSRRVVLLGCGLLLAPHSPLAGADSTPSSGQPADPWVALRNGAIVLLRHANAPGVGDPPDFRLGECATQRNLDDAGRAQAQRIGAAFQRHQVKVGAVIASQWCRARETAELAFPGRITTEPAFNSFFQRREQSNPQTDAARKLLLQWSGPGALVVVTHQVNISALTSQGTASGEGIVLQQAGQQLRIVGRIQP